MLDARMRLDAGSPRAPVVLMGRSGSVRSRLGVTEWACSVTPVASTRFSGPSHASCWFASSYRRSTRVMQGVDGGQTRLGSLHRLACVHGDDYAFELPFTRACPGPSAELIPL